MVGKSLAGARLSKIPVFLHGLHDAKHCISLAQHNTPVPIIGSCAYRLNFNAEWTF